MIHLEQNNRIIVISGRRMNRLDIRTSVQAQHEPCQDRHCFLLFGENWQEDQ